MSLLVSLLGLALVGVGAWGTLQPRRLITLSELWQTQERRPLAAGIRVAAGVVLLLGAPGSDSAGGLRLLGVAAILAGVATLFVGDERVRAVTAWFDARSDATVRAYALIPVALGLWLMWVA